MSAFMRGFERGWHWRPFVGTVRRALFLPWSCPWNGWVRGGTAWLEWHGLLRSER